MFAFYRDVLGLETTRADPGEGYEVGVDWAQFTDGHGGEIELFDHGRFGRGFEFPLPRANAAVLTFRVEDLEAELSRLRACGVEFFSEGWYDWGARRTSSTLKGTTSSSSRSAARRALPRRPSPVSPSSPA